MRITLMTRTHWLLQNETHLYLAIRAQMTHRSWMKLARMTFKPSFSLPITYLFGTTTSSNKTNAVPAAEE